MAQQISKGWLYGSTGTASQVTHTNLNAHVDNATLLIGAVTDQPININSSDTDKIVIAKSDGISLNSQTKADFTKSLTVQSIGAVTGSDVTISPQDGTIVTAVSYVGTTTSNTVTSNAHALTAGQIVLISSATGSQYNGTYRIASVTTNTFTYNLGTTVTAGSGTLSYTKQGSVRNIEHEIINGNVYVDGSSNVTGNLNVTGTVSLSGTSTATTKSVNTNTNDIATTAYVVGQAGTIVPSANGTASAGTSLKYAREDHIHPETSPIKAWARFNPSASSGGLDSRANRTAGSTTATISMSGSHGLTTGNKVIFNSEYPSIIPTGVYSVTVTTASAFTIQTVATTALTNAICSGFSRFEGFNISGYQKNAQGDYTVSFTDLISSNFYGVQVFLGLDLGSSWTSSTIVNASTSSIRLGFTGYEFSNGVNAFPFDPTDFTFSVIL